MLKYNLSCDIRGNRMKWSKFVSLDIITLVVCYFMNVSHFLHISFKIKSLHPAAKRIHEEQESTYKERSLYFCVCQSTFHHIN